MISNLERYKIDLNALISKGIQLENAIQCECFPGDFQKEVKKTLGENTNDFIKNLPDFISDYQLWYSEAKTLIKQLLPERLEDFVRIYEKPKTRKSITRENYCIEDYLKGINITIGYEKKKIAGPEDAIPVFRQQLAILKSVKKRFESSLFDIQQLVQADLFDSELDAARELNKNKFTRSAGALAGVVLERHLSQVCNNHNLKIKKKEPSISDFNDTLKNSSVIDTLQWRFIQHLSDIRNLCDHNKEIDPTIEQVDELITGVIKIIKTMF